MPVLGGRLRPLLWTLLGLTMNLSIPTKDEYDDFKNWGKIMLIYPQSNFDEVLDQQRVKINEKLDEFTEKGSGWKVDLIHSVNFEMYGFQQLNGSGTFIELPTKLANKRACVNVKNQDNKS